MIKTHNNSLERKKRADNQSLELKINGVLPKRLTVTVMEVSMISPNLDDLGAFLPISTDGL